MIIRTGLGQDSHRFLPPGSSKPCVLGGLTFHDVPGFQANSDGDVILHAICNAISSLTRVWVLGGIADELCLKAGITDSEVYLREAMKTLGKQQITYVSVTVEGKRPKLRPSLMNLCENIARIMELDVSQVGVTVTSGEGLSDVGCGDGVQAFALVTTMET